MYIIANCTCVLGSQREREKGRREPKRGERSTLSAQSIPEQQASILEESARGDVGAHTHTQASIDAHLQANQEEELIASKSKNRLYNGLSLSGAPCVSWCTSSSSNAHESTTRCCTADKGQNSRVNCCLFVRTQKRNTRRSHMSLYETLTDSPNSLLHFDCKCQ